MLCSKCQKREAKIYCTEIINGEKKEQYLCEECAAEYASFQLESAGFKESGLGGLLSSILGGMYKGAASQEQEKTNDFACPGCGMTYTEFLNTGKFGCADCYKSFGRALGKCFKQIQGSDTHVGKRPRGFVSPVDKMVSGMTELEKLTMRLHEAIEKEEFEEAARLRDLIREQKAQEPSPEQEQEGIPNA